MLSVCEHIEPLLCWHHIFQYAFKTLKTAKEMQLTKSATSRDRHYLCFLKFLLE